MKLSLKAIVSVCFQMYEAGFKEAARKGQLNTGLAQLTVLVPVHIPDDHIATLGRAHQPVAREACERNNAIDVLGDHAHTASGVEIPHAYRVVVRATDELILPAQELQAEHSTRMAYQASRYFTVVQVPHTNCVISRST